MNKKNIYQLFFIIIAILSSCAGDTYHIIIDDIPDNSVDLSDSTNTLTPISFSVSVTKHNQHTSTKSNTDGIINLPVGRYVTIYVYRNNNTPETGYVYTQAKFICKKAGYLTPLYSGLSLPEGVYNLYAVSTLNATSDKTPNFSLNMGGEANNLSNGLDYLWWSESSVSVSGETPQIIPIEFEHVATKITINCAGESNNILSKLSNLTIQSPDPFYSDYQLATGEISSSAFLNTYNLQTTIDGFVASAYIVPYTATFDYKLTGMANVTINNQFSGWKSFSLPLPDDGDLESGTEYIYTIFFSLNRNSNNKIQAKVELTEKVKLEDLQFID